MPTRVLLCGTHPSQYNGYSKVVYELSRYLATLSDIRLTVYGFQNFYNKEGHGEERKLPDNVIVYDAFKYENPKKKGFGESIFIDFVQVSEPDIIIIYNDILIINALLDEIEKWKKEKGREQNNNNL